MLAFQNTTYTKESAVALAKLHREQDDFIRGTYGHATTSGGWKGCSVGCMAKGKHIDYPELFGVDVRIAYLSDKFFESIEDYKNWTVDLFESIKDSSDTTIAYYKFMHWMIADPEFGVVRFNKNQSILDVAKLFLKASKGDIVTNINWNAAADAAATATATAAAAADATAYAAATAAAAAADAAATATATATAYAATAAADAAAYAAYAAATATAATAATAAANKQNHYEIMAKKLMWFLAGN